MFLNCQLASPALQAANIAYNSRLIIALANKAISNKNALLVLPELALSGGFLGDLQQTQDLEDQIQHYLQDILLASGNWPKNFVLVLGTPWYEDHRCYNAAVAICHGEILAKSFLEQVPLAQQAAFTAGKQTAKELFILPIFGPYRPLKMALAVGADLALYQSDPEIDILIHISATPALDSNLAQEKLLLTHTALNGHTTLLHVNAALYCPASKYLTEANIYANEGGTVLADQTLTTLPYLHELFKLGNLQANDPDLLAKALTLSDNSSVTCDLLVPRMRSLAKRRAKALPQQHYQPLAKVYKACGGYFDLRAPKQRLIDVAPFLYQTQKAQAYSSTDKNSYYARLWERLALAILRRMTAVQSEVAVLGLSGGLDSTVALLAIYLAYKLDQRDVTKIHAYQLPGLGSSKKSHNNATALLQTLHIPERVISIVAACEQHFKDIEQDPNTFDAAYENTQARERTQILMDKANQLNGLVFGTGDLSEAALGWCTYNGDQMSMYNLNASIPKTMMPPLLAAFPTALSKLDCSDLDLAALTVRLNSIMQAEISPELLPLAKDGSLQQSTANSIGSYVLHDFFIYHLLDGEYTAEDLESLANLAFSEDNIQKLLAANYDYSPNSNVYACRTFPTAEINRALQICLKRIQSQQFKRNVAPDGINITHYNLADYCQFPSDLQSNLFLHRK